MSSQLSCFSITISLRPTTSILSRFSSFYHARHALHLPARHLLNGMPERDSASYNSIIAARCREGLVDEACALLSRMMAHNLQPTPFTFVPIFSSQSLDVPRGTQMHTLLLKTGMLHSDPYSATALMGHYGKNRRMDDAVKLFDEMPVRTVVTWNCIISGFSQMSFVEDSALLFRELLRAELRLSEASFLGVLSAFRSSESSYVLEQVHGLVIKSSMDSYAVVSNALLSAYSSCFTASVSERLFCDLPVKDLVSWNTNISAFARSGTPERALELFYRMLLAGVLPSENTIASVLVACIGVNSPVYGELIHAQAIKHNLSSSVYVGSSLVDFYAKCKRLEDAHNMFREILDNVECSDLGLF